LLGFCPEQRPALGWDSFKVVIKKPLTFASCSTQVRASIDAAELLLISGQLDRILSAAASRHHCDTAL